MVGLMCLRDVKYVERPWYLGVLTGCDHLVRAEKMGVDSCKSMSVCGQTLGPCLRSVCTPTESANLPHPFPVYLGTQENSIEWATTPR